MDNAGTLLVMTFPAAALISTGLSEDAVMSRTKNPNGLLPGLIIGSSFIVLGGDFAGRMACRAEVSHRALVAVIGMVLAVVFRESGSPIWFDSAAVAGILPVGMGGGHLEQKRRADPSVNPTPGGRIDTAQGRERTK